MEEEDQFEENEDDHERASFNENEDWHKNEEKDIGKDI